MEKQQLKRWIVGLLKYGVSLAILVWLVNDAWQSDAFQQVIEQPKHWGFLVAAWLSCFVAVAISMLRWRALVRALDIPFGVGESFRLGFLGYLFNFVSLGAVGGDVVKAVVLARERPGRRADAVATVLIDRIVGLYSLLLFCTTAILVTGQLSAEHETVRVICRSIVLMTGAATVGLLVLAIVGGRLKAASVSQRLPRAVHVLWQLAAALTMYRHRPRALALALLLSMGTHSLITLGFYLISRGLPGVGPTLAENFVAVPVSMLTGVLPLPVNGLGALEGVIDYLYQHIAASGLVAKGEGLSVSLVYRAMTIVIAMVGVVFYLLHRREMDDCMRNAEADEAAAEEELEHVS